MSEETDIIRAELPVVKQIIQDEIWLEGERRGCSVSSYDPVVTKHVADVLFRNGERIRKFMQGKLHPREGFS